MDCDNAATAAAAAAIVVVRGETKTTAKQGDI